jgi:hypothetical protein
MRNAQKASVGKPEGKRPLADIGIDGWQYYIVWECWLGSTMSRQDPVRAVVNTAMNTRVPYKLGRNDLLISWATISFSIKTSLQKATEKTSHVGRGRNKYIYIFLNRE